MHQEGGLAMRFVAVLFFPPCSCTSGADLRGLCLKLFLRLIRAGGWVIVLVFRDAAYIVGSLEEGYNACDKCSSCLGSLRVSIECYL